MITAYVSSGYNSTNLFAYYSNGDGNAVHLGISPDTAMLSPPPGDSENGHATRQNWKEGSGYQLYECPSSICH
jgi:hypothetical protein